MQKGGNASCRPSFARVVAGLELEPTRNLDNAVQTTAADRVRRSDLTKRRTVDIEDGIAGSTQPQTRRNYSGQEISVIENVECVRTNLEAHSFSKPDALRERHVQLCEQWTIDRTPGQSAELTRTIIKEHLTRKRRLAKSRCAATIGANYRRIDVVDVPVLIEDADQVTNLRVGQTRDCRLVCRSARTIQRASRVDDGQRCSRVDTQNTTQLPTSYEPVNRTTATVEKALSFSERQIVNRIEIENVRLIVISAPVVEMRILIVEECCDPRLIFAVQTGIARADVVESFLERVVGLQ